MAYKGTPVVRNHMLLLDDPPQRIQLDSPAWWAWLETAAAFNYMPPHSYYSLTLRKEKRRQCWYWYAYLKVDSKLHNAYVGRSADLTAARLQQLMQTLLEKIRRHTKQQPA
jgi:LuxR family maltose regulon positive regulatory protein